MRWSTYKTLCDRPDYFSRWMLEQSIDLLGQLGECPLRVALDEALEGPVLAPPADHHGPAATEMLRLTLSVEQRQACLSAMQRAVRQGLTTSATRLRGLGGFVEAWRDYASFAD